MKLPIRSRPIANSRGKFVFRSAFSILIMPQSQTKLVP
jgi:hypothetical protein